MKRKARTGQEFLDLAACEGGCVVDRPPPPTDALDVAPTTGQPIPILAVMPVRLPVPRSWVDEYARRLSPNARVGIISPVRAAELVPPSPPLAFPFQHKVQKLRFRLVDAGDAEGGRAGCHPSTRVELSRAWR